MKKSILFAVAAILSALLSAQAPLGMNYQAVIRNAAGTPAANGMVRIKFTIHDVSSSGRFYIPKLPAYLPISLA